MLVLGIETSCDETSAAVVQDGVKVLSCVIASSQGDFTGLGGVIPEDAARQQLQSIIPVVEQSLLDAGITGDALDLIAVTYGPGLLGSLLVGTTTARVLAARFKKPLIPVHHTLGHLSSTWLSSEGNDDPLSFPIITLSVSGGHSDLWYRTAHTKGMLIGSTLDDAAGEAFDKGAVLLGLPYPGGPALAALAKDGDETAYPFPLPLKGEKTFDFSFSGLKTSLKYLLRDCKIDPLQKSNPALANMAASYQLALCEHLVRQTVKATQEYPDVHEVHLVGGVSSNERLRLLLKDNLSAEGVSLRIPTKRLYCTDNAAMIAAAGYFVLRERPEQMNAVFATSATNDLGAFLKASA